MHNQYQFYVSVETPDRKHFNAQFVVDAHSAPQFHYYDLCDSSCYAAITGGVVAEGALRINSERRRLAKQIAEKLTDHILESIKASDTINGYAKE